MKAFTDKISKMKINKGTMENIEIFVVVFVRKKDT